MERYRFHIEAYGTKGMLRAYYAPMMTLAIYMEEPGGKPHRKYNFYPMNIVREKMHGWQSEIRIVAHIFRARAEGKYPASKIAPLVFLIEVCLVPKGGQQNSLG